MERIENVKKFLNKEKLDGVIIFNPSNRRYLCGFTGSTGYLVVTENKNFFLVDFRYVEQAQQECPDFETVSIKGEWDVFPFLKGQKIKSLAIEESFVSVAFANKLTKMGDVERLVSVDEVLKNMRMYKDDEEIAHIRRACHITDLAFEHILKKIDVGMTEANIDLLLQTFMRQYPEVERMVDRFIVAAGEHGALPHGIAGERQVKKGNFITMDFGCNCGGYWSDVTRTVCLGSATEKQREIYEIVKSAQDKAIVAVKAGKTGTEIDRVARDIIANAGYSDYFGHGLGHS
ncbi:MAG: Xaa-Pro peptidase family protein, partial [Oscillospiraceae bacterium]